MLGAYQIAWDLLKAKVQTKPSWGRNELDSIMKDCLIEGYEQKEALSSEEEITQVVEE